MFFIIWLLYSKRHHTPVWDTWCTAATMFNEEPGEISLSRLSRQTKTVYPDRTGCEKLSEMYVVGGQKANMKKEAELVDRRSRRGHRIHETDPGVQTTIRFLQEQIAQIAHGAWRMPSLPPETWTKVSTTVYEADAPADVDYWGVGYIPGKLEQFIDKAISLVSHAAWLRGDNIPILADEKGTCYSLSRYRPGR